MKSDEIQRTLGGKNKVFRTLGMSATGLIEQEGPLIGSLGRVCAGLRGEGFEWRWKGDELVDEGEKEGQRGSRTSSRRRGKRDRVPVSAVEEEKVEEEVELQNKKQKTTAPPLQPQEPIDAVTEETTPLPTPDLPPLPSTTTSTEEQPAIKPESPPLPSTLPTTSALDAGTNTDADDVQALLPKLPDLPLPPTEVEGEGEGEEEEKMDVDAPIYGGEGVGEEEPSEEEQAASLRRRSGRVASRSNTAGVNQRNRSRSQSSTSSGGESGLPLSGAGRGRRRGGEYDSATGDNDEEDDEEEEEVLPKYASRLVDPEVYVRSLFVSRDNVELDVGGGGGGMDRLSPNEQEVLVHDCLTLVFLWFFPRLLLWN